MLGNDAIATPGGICVAISKRDTPAICDIRAANSSWMRTLGRLTVEEQHNNMIIVLP